MPNQFAPAPIDFGFLSDAADNYAKGDTWRRARETEALRKQAGSVFGSNGETDYGAMARWLAAHGDLEGAKSVAGIQSLESGGGGVYGTPIYGTDAEGNTVVGAIGKNGAFRRLDTGGITPMPGIRAVDTGTGTAILNSRTGQPMSENGFVPKDVAGVAAEKAKGEVAGQSAASIPDVVANVRSAIETVDQAIKAPGRETATGMSSTFDPRNWVNGTDATSYRVGPLKQVQGQAFLGSIQQMRGLGALSNQEGEAATAASTALNTAQTDEDHLHALRTLKAIQLRGLVKIYEKAGQQPPQDVVQAWQQAEQESGLAQSVPFSSAGGGVPPGAASPAPAPQGGQGGAQRTSRGIQWSIEP